MNRRRAPKLGSLLLRIRGLGDRRAEVEADLLELFTTRARHYGERYARRRYYGDVLSLWRPSGMGMRIVQSSHPTNRVSVGREIGQDLTYAWRLLRRSPGVVAVTVLGLGLAIGVSTAVFSLLNAAVFRPTGTDDPASAVRVMRAYRNGIGNAWRYADYLLLHDGARGVRLEASLRDGASILAVFALALALAVVGLYGVTAFVVGQRTQEISVRIALGACGRDITRLLLHDSLRPVAVGLAAGVVVALLGGRVFAGVLYGVSTADPIAFGAAVLILLSAAILAVIVPTRGAASVDPAAVLRQL